MIRAPSAEDELERLSAGIRGLESVVVCFSGGIDSALVLAVAARELGERALGLTARSASLPERERLDAARIAATLGARHEWVDSRELERPAYAANGPDRCFHCKTELYELAEARRLQGGFSWIANGTNQDDLGDYRPGLDAARAAHVRSPLLEAGLDKAAVRRVAELLGLDVWDKPAAACLSSRIPYGNAVTRERLGRIEAVEAGLQELGFRQVRVRYHEDVARIELPLPELRRAVEPELQGRIVELGRAHGFRYVTLDLAGYRSGSLNEVLEGRRLRVL